MRRKTTAIATTLAMILSLLPVGALPSWAAAEIINMENVESDVIISGTHSGECPGHTFTRRSTKHRIIVEGGTHTITFENNAGVNLSGRDDDEACALSIREGANVTLIVSSESTLKSGGDCAGIAVDGGTVTISGSSTVNATGGGTGGAGIAVDGGTVRIQGGTVKAKGGSGGAGITTGAGGTVVITGGTVTATGAGGGAGIGGCAGGDSAGAVNIQGGSVTATGAGGGAGIGGGAGGASAGNVNIQSGSVTATGSGGGAGIGGGAGGESKATPTINGGTVTATGGDGDGAGIGDTVGISLLGGKAVVFASSISKISDNWQGIAFVGNDGQVYGDFTLPRNLPVESGHTLTIPEDATLTIPSGR
ncbi:MAG: hypothetical protein Q4C56_05115, partial [Peptococcaceae bacterium]|nr:hypothetical protein [Peptococcaceae bacterium]